MSDENSSPPPHLLLTVLFALWAMAFVYAFVGFATAVPEGSGFTRGMNRITTFLGWQGIAGLLGLCVFGVSRGWGKGTSVRKLGLVPLGLSLCIFGALLCMVGWAVLTA